MIINILENNVLKEDPIKNVALGKRIKDSAPGEIIKYRLHKRNLTYYH